MTRSQFFALITSEMMGNGFGKGLNSTEAEELVNDFVRSLNKIRVHLVDSDTDQKIEL